MDGGKTAGQLAGNNRGLPCPGLPATACTNAKINFGRGCFSEHGKQENMMHRMCNVSGRGLAGKTHDQGNPAGFNSWESGSPNLNLAGGKYMEMDERGTIIQRFLWARKNFPF